MFIIDTLTHTPCLVSYKFSLFNYIANIIISFIFQKNHFIFISNVKLV